MKVRLKDEALEDLRAMDGSVRPKFLKHIEKLGSGSLTRHIVNHNIEEVGDGRIIFQVDLVSDTVYVIRCFVKHKDYDRWRDSFR